LSLRREKSPDDDWDDSDLDDDISEAALDDGYWDLDELGIDPEEFYDLCPLSRSARP
jgi:hypothetical protein